MPADSQYDAVDPRNVGKERYACYNRGDFSKGYFALTRRYNQQGAFVHKMTYIPHAMSTGCRSFTLWDTDPRCAGCTATKDEAYAQRMRGMT